MKTEKEKKRNENREKIEKKRRNEMGNKETKKKQKTKIIRIES